MHVRYMSKILYTNNYHLLPKQNSLTSTDPWIIVETEGNHPKQKTEVSKDRGLTIFILKKT